MKDTLQISNIKYQKSKIQYFLLTTFYLFITILFFSNPPKSFAAKLYLSPPTGNYPAGQEFSSLIQLDTEGARTAGTDVFLTFDPQILEAARIVDGEIYDSYIGKNIDNQNGQLSLSGIISLGESEGFNGEDTFATIVFVGKKAGTSKVEFDFSPGEKTESNVAALNSTDDNLTSASGATYTITASIKPSPPASTLEPRTSNAPEALEELPKSGSLSDTLKAAAPGVILFVLAVLFVI